MEIINIDENFNLEQYCKQYVKEHDEWPTIYSVRSHTQLFKTFKNFGVFTEYSEAERAFETNRFVRFGVYCGIVKNVVATYNSQKSRALLVSLCSEFRNFKQLFAVGKVVGFTVFNYIFGYTAV